MSRPLALAALLLTATACAPVAVRDAPPHTTGQPPRPPDRTVVVDHVVDGDTFILTGGERIRLLSIDSPELHANTRADDAKCGAQAARDALAGLIPPGTPVTLRGLPGEPAEDVFGRTLSNAYVPLDGTDAVNVSMWLIRNGHARAYREYPTPETGEAIRLETQAREAGRGMWGMCSGGAR